MSRKTVSILLILAFVFTMAIFTGCGNNAGTNDNKEASSTVAEAEKTEAEAPAETAKEPVTLTYSNFSAGADNADALNAMIASFEADNPNIKIESNPVGYGEHFTQLATQIAAGNAPDCYELNIENFLAFALRDKPVELGPLFAQSGADPNVYGKGVLDAVSLDGKQYAIPLSYSTVVLIYNKDLFDKAGVAYPTADWTWNDELEAAKKIRALGNDTWGMFQEVQFWEFYKTVQQNGGNLISSDGKTFTINSPENVETLQYMLDRVRVHKVMPSESERADRGQGDLFKEGKLGMFRGGVWSFTDFASSIKDFKWDVQVEPGNTKKATHFFANVASISKNSKYPLEAFKFINAMGSDKQIANIRLVAKWEIPPVVDPDIVKSYLSKTPPDNRKAVLDSMNFSVTPPKLEQFQQLTDIINPQLEAARTNDKSAKEILDALQTEVSSKITLK